MKLLIELKEGHNKIGISTNITGTNVEILGMIEMAMSVLQKEKATYLNATRKEDPAQ